MFSATKGYWCRLYTWYTSFTSLLTCESKEFNYRVVWKPYRPPARPPARAEGNQHLGRVARPFIDEEELPVSGAPARAVVSSGHEPSDPETTVLV